MMTALLVLEEEEEDDMFLLLLAAKKALAHVMDDLGQVVGTAAGLDQIF